MITAERFFESDRRAHGDRSAGPGAAATSDSDLSILFLSSSLLDDRKLLYTSALERICELARVAVWASSAATDDGRNVWAGSRADVRPLPAVLGYPEFPHNWLRRLNEFIWDKKLCAASRESIWRHTKSKRARPSLRLARGLGQLLSYARVHSLFDRWLERLLLRHRCSPAAEHLLRDAPPSVVVTTGPNRFEEPGIANAAKRLGIPVMAAIHSWDNLSVKSRMAVDYDAYLVWSDHMRLELDRFFPRSRSKRVYVVGAVQFDVFFQERFQQSRSEFCAGQGLRADLPIVVYALGSPNFIDEQPGAVEFARRVVRGDLGDVQLLVRPHPQFFDGTEARQLLNFGPRVIVQRTGHPSMSRASRFQDVRQTVEWINTFRHANVVINLSSTVTVDAALCDAPIVNLNFDPSPGRAQHRLVKDINNLWDHFSPLARSGGVWLADDMDQVVEGAKTYLAMPELHRDERRWIVNHVCGFADGRCGERLAAAIVDFAQGGC